MSYWRTPSGVDSRPRLREGRLFAGMTEVGDLGHLFSFTGTTQAGRPEARSALR